VVRVVVDRRDVVAGGTAFGAAGAYERLAGRVYFAFDPRNPHDRRIVDLERAPRNAAARSRRGPSSRCCARATRRAAAA
jgi:hypothetical protein